MTGCLFRVLGLFWHQYMYLFLFGRFGRGEKKRYIAYNVLVIVFSLLMLSSFTVGTALFFDGDERYFVDSLLCIFVPAGVFAILIVVRIIRKRLEKKKRRESRWYLNQGHNNEYM